MKSRGSYTPEQVRIIASHQTERNALSTLIAYRSGLRPYELLTLRRIDEVRPSDYRTWRSDRFHGRDGVRYIVTRAVGLRREVLLPPVLAERLEARRLAAPRLVIDRKIHYEAYYDIGGGKNFSQSFTTTSKRVFGSSRGARGLRYSYVQERMAELQGSRKLYNEAREIVSQEMGCFRIDVINTYLR
jgi:integrase